MTMIEKILNCPVCNSLNICHFAYGADNKELFEMLELKPCKSGWSHCKECNHVFLNPKFSSEIEKRLYGEESVYRKYSIGNQTLGEYFASIDNTIANKNGVHSGHLKNVEKILEIISLNQGSLVLDFGAGFGAASSAFLSKKMNYTGYEFDEFCLNVAKEHGRNVHRSVQKSPEFDFVYSAQVFEHISKPGGAVNDLAEFAKEGAYVFINVPTHQFTLFPPQNLANGGILCMNWGHFHSYSLESLSYLIQKTNCLEVVASWYSNNDVNVLARKSESRLQAAPLFRTYLTSYEQVRFYFSKFITSNLWKVVRGFKTLIKTLIGR